MNKIELHITGPGYDLEQAHFNDVGYDLKAYLPNGDIRIESGQRAMISTGISVSVITNEHIYLRIAPRSGLALNKGIDVFAGVVDKSYRGEIKVILFNSDTEPFIVKDTDKIAQLIIERCLLNVPVLRVNTLDDTERNINSFGSTG